MHLTNTVWMDSDLICQTTYIGGQGCDGIFPTTLNNSRMGCSGNAKGKWTKEEGEEKDNIPALVATAITKKKKNMDDGEECSHAEIKCLLFI